MSRAFFAVLGLASSAALANEFQEGCAKAATEVLCVGHDACVIGAFVDRAKNGIESEQSGIAECGALAKAAKKKGATVEAKKAIARLKKKLATANQQLKKTLPFLTLTADFDRFMLEDLVRTLRSPSDRSIVVGYAPTDDSTRFENEYLNPIVTALLNSGRDELGKAFLKERLSEVRIGLRTHGGTAQSPKIEVVNRVLIIPGIQTVDNTGYTSGLHEFLEKHL